MEKIRSRTIKSGDKNEGTWPPRFGVGGIGIYHRDEKGKIKKGPPPIKQKIFGQAPAFIADTIKPYYHPAACKWTESRSELNKFDEFHGTFTTDKLQKAPTDRLQRLKKEREEDRKKSLYQAVELVDSGNAPLSEETKALCAIQNEIVSSALNFDAFNVAGRKNDARGKRFRKPKIRTRKGGGATEGGKTGTITP